MSLHKDINCWIAGGERLYSEALLHSSAQCIHLTLVDYDLDPNITHQHLARFPVKYRWDHKFRLIHQEDTLLDTDSGFKYQHVVYERKGRKG